MRNTFRFPKELLDSGVSHLYAACFKKYFMFNTRCTTGKLRQAHYTQLVTIKK